MNQNSENHVNEMNHHIDQINPKAIFTKLPKIVRNQLAKLTELAKLAKIVITKWIELAKLAKITSIQ